MDDLIKRYDIPIMDGVMLGRGDDPDGEWVRYDDHAAALAEAQKTIESLEKTIGEIVAGLAWAESHESEWGVAEVLAIARAALSPREGEG